MSVSIIHRSIRRIALMCAIILFSKGAQAQEDRWDNMLFVGNKISWGQERWKTTGELQFRLKDDLRALDQWFVEGMGSYLASKNWEFTLPVRYAVKPEFNEFRPGFGALYKMYPKSAELIQISHQVLYQADINPNEVQHGLRYVAFYNHKINESLIPNAAAGIFYRWSEDYTGIQFARAGVGLTYIVDAKHTLNFTYFVGATYNGELTSYQGMPFLQAIFNLGTNFQHIPAKYINF
ncbi:DUF2490 domain-containing protein [Cryomorphaceae bacterium]|nr:DUF2490 domain-containing protein [Cryomorphaceae bacterium]